VFTLFDACAGTACVSEEAEPPEDEELLLLQLKQAAKSKIKLKTNSVPFFIQISFAAMPHVKYKKPVIAHTDTPGVIPRGR
jgi:hypothetical protein